MNTHRHSVWILSRVVIAACFVGAVATPCLAQADRMIGTWKVNVAKSTNHPDSPISTGIVKFEKVAEGIRQSSIGPDGKTVGTPFVVNFDGKDYPIVGNAAYDAVAWTLVDDYSFNFVRKKAGRVVHTATRAIAPDGKTSTLITIGATSKGVPFNSVIVYEKQ